MTGGCFVIESGRDRHQTCDTVNGKPSARITVQGVGDRIGRRIRIGRKGGDADCRPDGCVFRNRVRRHIRICHSSRIEFIQIVDRDCECGVGR